MSEALLEPQNKELPSPGENLRMLLVEKNNIDAQIDDLLSRDGNIAQVALIQIRDMISRYRFSPADVFPPVPRVAPKYRDPATGHTWSGRGKPPAWIDGKDKNNYRV